MLPIAPPVFPKSLNYGLQRLANLSRRKVRLTSVSGTTAAPSGLITVELPQEAIDLDTFALHAKLTTTATGGSVLPASADMLVADYTISVGGQVIGTSFADAYNQLKLIYDQYQAGDKANVSMLLNNCLPSSSTGVFGAPAANATNRPIAINQWLGFIGSAQPRVLDLAMLPKVQLTIRLASTDVLILSTAGITVPNYSLSDIAFEVDVLSLPSMYYEALNAHLQSGGVIEVPFTNYVPFRSSAASIQGANQQFSVASGSLDAIIATVIKAANFGDRAFNSATYTSKNFSRGTADFTGVRVSVNQVPFPAYGEQDAARCALSVIENLTGSYDVLGSSSAALTSLSAFTDGHFVSIVRLNHHDSAYGNRLVCGMNTSGNPAVVNITYSGSGSTSVVPMAWAQTTSLLRIGQFKQVEWQA